MSGVFAVSYTHLDVYKRQLLTLTTGLRISEVIAVKFSDIDWWEGELHVRRQLGRTTSNDGEAEERLCTQEMCIRDRDQAVQRRPAILSDTAKII